MAVPRIFVSYSTTSQRDYQFAMQLASDLRARGAEVDVSEATVPPEQVVAYLNWELSQCQWFILVQTPEAVSSQRVHTEVETALDMYKQQRLLGMVAVQFVPTERSTIPFAWRAMMTPCDASQNYYDGLFHVSQILELAHFNSPSPLEQPPNMLAASPNFLATDPSPSPSPTGPFPPPARDEGTDTLVAPDEGNQDLPGLETTQRRDRNAQKTGPTPGTPPGMQEMGPGPRNTQDMSAMGPAPGFFQDMPAMGPGPRNTQDMPGQGHFQGYDQGTQNASWALGSPAPAPPEPRPRRPSLLKISFRPWMALIAGAVVVLLFVGFLINALGRFGNFQPGVPVNVNATATAITAKANATALALSTTPQGRYTLVMQSQPTLSDPLRSQDTNQWDANSSQTGGCAFTGGAYHVSITAANQHTACLSRKAEFKNFAYQAQMTLLNGDAGGIVFRSDSAVSTFYRFIIDSTGAYRLFSCKGCPGNQNAGTLLVSADMGIKANQPNTLTVIAINNTIDVYINGQFVKSVNDATSGAGNLGVYAGTFTQAYMHPTEVAFSNVKVWAL